MKNLRRKFERFCYKNRTIGIPNLMLFISLGTALVYIMTMYAGTNILYNLLCFDRDAILHGQVWRLFTYVFTYGVSKYGLSINPLWIAIGLFCYFSLGRAMENVWGTLRFNLYYFCGIILMDVYSMIFSCDASVDFLNLSLFLGYATLYPDTHFLILFIIPVKAWIFAMFYLVLALLDLFGPFPGNLFSIIALSNYFLFFGKDVANIIPLSWRANFKRLFHKNKKTTSKASTPKVIPFPTAGSYQASTATTKAPYTHCCTVCNRTDVSHPELEFRYCSRCNGYRCYCEDHINNHTHE